MAEVIRMPKMSDTMTEGVIGKWLKKVGDTIKSGDVLAEVETDKATMDFELYQNGTLLYIGVKEGDAVPIDAIIAILGKAGEDYKSLLKDSDASIQVAAKSGSNAKEAALETKRDTYAWNVAVSGLDATAKTQYDPSSNNLFNKLPQKKVDDLLIFISHSSKDALIVKAFVDKILKLSLKIESDQLFCTSLDENSIRSGEDFRDAIKQKLQQASLVILIISENYRTSEVCLNEMGAAWVLSNKVVPFIVPPIDYTSVGFIHEPNQLLKINKKENLLKFIDEEKAENNRVKLGEITRHIDEFLTQIKGLINNNPVNRMVKPIIRPVNELGLLDGDIVELNNREGLYLFQNEKLTYIADDSAFSLHVYGLNRKDRKSINHTEAKQIIDKQLYIPVLYGCKIMIDTATNKKWLLVNGERRFLPNQVYSILVKRDGYKLVSLSHDEVMRIPEGDKLNDIDSNFSHLLA